MNKSPEAGTFVSRNRTGLATGTGVGNLRHKLEELGLQWRQERLFIIAESLAEKVHTEERFTLHDEKSRREKLEYYEATQLLFALGVFPSRHELDIAYPLGIRSPYEFLDLLRHHNEQRGGVKISLMPYENNEPHYTDLGIASSFPGVVMHIIHNEEVFNMEQDYWGEPSLSRLGISRIELEITKQAYELPQP